MAIPADVIAGSAERDQHDALRSCVDELAAHLGADPHQVVAAKDVLDALHQQRQLTLEDEVDLLLVAMRVYASALTGLEHEQVDAEAVHAQLAAQGLEALAAVAIELGERYVRFGHRLLSIEPREGQSTQAQYQSLANHYVLAMIFKVL